MLNKLLHALEIFSLRITVGLTMCLSVGVVPAFAGPLSLSTIPLYSANGVPPNIVLTFDDSGSMTWGYLPDSIEDGTNNNGSSNDNSLADNRRGCSSEVNKIYYNPATTYLPPVKQDGAPLNATPTSFAAAYTNGFNTGAGTVNLATGFRVTWNPLGFTFGPTYADCTTGNTTGQAAFYYQYNSSCGNPNSDACYTLVQHNNAAAGGAWTAAQQQNFANWYSYYRTRVLMAKTATGRAFANIGGSNRIAGQHINNTSAGSGTSIKFTTTIGTLKQFCDDPLNTDPSCPNGSTARTDFFTRLYNSPASGGTPLRSAMQRAGNYFSSTTNGAYRDDPASGTSPERSCRQNFHIMMTDGYWNGAAGVTTNVDDTTVAFPAYSSPDPISPSNPYVGSYNPGGTDQLIYRDSTSSTLADNAFYYWSRDLRSDLGNNVPRHIVQVGPSDSVNKVFFSPKNDPAHWQHMVNYTIGLGINGTLVNENFSPNDYNALLNGTLNINGTTGWPAAVADTNTAVDDLWHAAVNSRGTYFSATNPTDLVSSLTTTLNDLGARSGSAAAAATSTFYVDTGFNFGVYQSGYNSSGWYGRLRKFTGTVTGTSLALNITGPDWDAATIINGQDPLSGRNIITYNPNNAAGFRGVAFLWGNLNTTQQGYLMDDPDTAPTVEAVTAAGQARLNYLRGDASEEANTTGYNFRARTTSKLGDIANSAPLYVGATLFKYSDTLEAANPSNPTTAERHSVFGTTTQTRTKVIYVGAGDGMLHGFNADTGTELLAYIPNTVYRNLNRLTSNSYSHLFYVDGSPAHGDVFYGGSWKTVLVGGLNAGGQGIYALNITNPSTFTEANANNIVLWEFSDTSDSGDDDGDTFPDYELGYTFSEPVITRVRTSSTTTKWVAIFGNGYNNTDNDGAYSRTGFAFLYIVDISNGNLLKKISTKTGSTGTPNGLGNPAVLDWDGDQVIDYVYAGDLQGNLWKFDLTGGTPSNWKVAYGNSTTPRPVYKAVDDKGTSGTADDVPQPITAAPETTFHPTGVGNGFLIFFGTGKMLETGDSSAVGANTQAVYGIWDKNTNGTSTPVVQTDLLRQSVTETATRNGIEYRNVSNTPMTWRTGSTGTCNPPTSGYNCLGWYLKLPDAGEKQVTNLDLKGGHLIFTTYVPSSDPCVSGGDGWQMELDYQSGGRLPASPFDTDLDGAVCECAADNVTFALGGSTPPGGRKGSPIERTILHGRSVDYKIENPLSGAMPTAYKEAAGKTDRGRQSWRQIK